MTKNTFLRGTGRRTRADITVSLSLAAVAAFFVISGVVSYMNISTLRRDTAAVTRTHEVLLESTQLLSTLKDAETGQRGFILTGKDSYLTPYSEALSQVEDRLTSIAALTQDDAVQGRNLRTLRLHINAKLNELAETIRVRRAEGFAPALAVVDSDHGKIEMDAIREAISSIQGEETGRRQRAIAEMNDAYGGAIGATAVAAILGLILSGVITVMISRATSAQRRQEWLQAGEAGLANALLGEQNMEQLGHNVLSFLAKYVGGHAGAFFVKEGGLFRRTATYGVPDASRVSESFRNGEGLQGEAAQSGEFTVLDNLETVELTAGAALGQWKPRTLMILPAQSEGTVDAIVELGFLNDAQADARAMLERVAESVSVAVRSARYRQHLQNLLEETQRQSEELQTQSEELRVSNEELEEQSRALKESHLRLEQQQAEMEQTNTQLEEQARLLEDQKMALLRTKEAVEQKADELEKASRYKSDFLANMSHELRTPLNSSLILAKLLSDNPDGNLSEEQVKFARTIQSSGNDLLALINDILDLSKIEAGQMEIRPEPVSVNRLLGDLRRTFDPIAGQKGLEFHTRVADGAPDVFDTDRQRLEQVLKNLLSNAFKFTESGSVELVIMRGQDDRLQFAVTDTGIGISLEQQRAVFEAFRQADGTISRKYGGTGLGLSISRELARLLGGTISLQSVQGEGSTFSLSLPFVYDPAGVAPLVAPAAEAPEPRKAAPAKAVPAKTAPKRETAAPAPSRRIVDDRDKLNEDSRSILIVEDDEAFARILYELAHDLDFLCLLSATAEDALATARHYRPSAIVLDVGLPDNSGLSVLDRLKHDETTRHIPVHVVSASDYAHAALSLGAVGYMLKPVKREELVAAFRKFESRLDSKMRHVLVVEDDDVQRDAVCRLLQADDVECRPVGTAAECLDALRASTFDCMVLDLSLPDASGYSLLETLSQEDAYSFPPVIVYTGHDLSYEDEQRLRRYSKSIIIKGAKSPERLLDEVSLFLHQVVSELSPEQQTLLRKARNRDSILEGRRILIVEDDVRNVYAVTNIFEPLGARVQIARNGREALEAMEKSKETPEAAIDLVLMDVMMPEMDGLTATRELRKQAEWKKLPVIMLTAKAMKDDQEKCLDAGANDYMAKPLDVEKLVSLVRVWMPR
ncbi:response regulator [Asticcacaulis solisilvae]|uniref:response regulator n=1 Tax=Asticcacaulis solisilvae TaxID=1217274 RepID=UPI003FD84523